MRLGLRPTLFEPETEQYKIRRLYGGDETIWERHRHRYEVGPNYVEQLEAPGHLRFIGKDERGERMQALELDSESDGAWSRFNVRDGLTHATSVFRPPVLRRSAGASRVLHQTSQPFSALPRLHRCSMWWIGSPRADGTQRERVHLASPRNRQGHPSAGGRHPCRGRQGSRGQGYQGQRRLALNAANSWGTTVDDQFP